MTDIDADLASLGAPPADEIEYAPGVREKAAEVSPVVRNRWYDKHQQQVIIDLEDGSSVTVPKNARDNPVLYLAREGDPFRGLDPVWPPRGMELEEAQVLARRRLQQWREIHVAAPIKLHSWHFAINHKLGDDFLQAGMRAALELKLGNAVRFHWVSWHGELVPLVQDDVIALTRLIGEREDQTRQRVHQFNQLINRCREVEEVDKIIDHINQLIRGIADELDRLGPAEGQQGPAAG